MADPFKQMADELKAATMEAAQLRQQARRLALDLAQAHDEVGALRARERSAERVRVFFEWESGADTDQSDTPPPEILGPFKFVKLAAGHSLFPHLLDDDDQPIAEFDAARGLWTSPLLKGRYFEEISIDGRTGVE